MEDQNNKGRLALERNLQKAFRSVETFYIPLQTVLTETLPTVTALANLLEQFECCKSVDSNVPLSSVGEVKFSLIFKLETEIASRLEELTDKIQVLKERNEAVSKFCESSRTLIEKYLSSLNFASLCSASPAKPSVSDMMEWLEDTDHLLYEQYHYKLHLLKTASTGEGVDSHNLVSLWKDQDAVLLSSIKDYLTRVELFLGEKV